jgi:hypothetical protein
MTFLPISGNKKKIKEKTVDAIYIHSTINFLMNSKNNKIKKIPNL